MNHRNAENSPAESINNLDPIALAEVSQFLGRVAGHVGVFFNVFATFYSNGIKEPYSPGNMAAVFSNY